MDDNELPAPTNIPIPEINSVSVPVSSDCCATSNISEKSNVNVENCSTTVDEVVQKGDLVGRSVKSLLDAFRLYNDHAFRVGFSVRKNGSRKRVDGLISMKSFCCSKEGVKKVPKKARSYSKLDKRTNCPAFIQFDLASCGSWIVTRHVTEHNHMLCPPESSHLLPSHRDVDPIQLEYLKELKKSGVGVADGVRVLKNQSGGSPSLGFIVRDAYNALSKSSIFDGTDSNTLIQTFKNRQANEKDFFFDFEVDSESRLCSFFWRDGRMRQDYELFGDLLVHDTTYRTNKYDMICGPFVGMNHHGKNVMFGCGFLINERTESFEWLFSAFLRSMGGKHPTTIMTDQSAAMAAAISKIFPMSRHRLCVWHIAENSKKHIMSLRKKKGFVELFNYLMKYVETEAEFQFYWDKMVKDYCCGNHSWILKLYDIREKWCRAFSKDWFSGGVLSSQRSESTNHSISRRLKKTHGLCDFYNMFIGVISEWRSNENKEDVRCMQGKPSMSLSDVKLLLHARDVYTIEIYSLFEEQFKKSTSCHQQLFVASDGSKNLKFHVWIDGVDSIKHEVIFDSVHLTIFCTCKLFFEVGILCYHCLRILNIYCVSSIPEMYIKKRWCKSVASERVLDDFPSLDSSKYSAGSLWRIQMNRKFQRLILASEDNNEARLKVEEAFEIAKRNVINEVGPIQFEDVVEPTLHNIVQNPQGSREKGIRNKRIKSMVEKKGNQAKGKRKHAQIAEFHTKSVVHGLQDGIVKIGGDGYVVHSTVGSNPVSNLLVVSPNTSSNLPPLPHSLSCSSIVDN